MATMDLLTNLFHVQLETLSKKEKLLLETILFNLLYQELIESYQVDDSNQKENEMINEPMIRLLINDLLSNNDYSLQGLASYSGFPEEVIYDLATGITSNPTLALSTKIIELHAIARKDFYCELIKKMITKLNKTMQVIM